MPEWRSHSTRNHSRMMVYDSHENSVRPTTIVICILPILPTQPSAMNNSRLPSHQRIQVRSMFYAPFALAFLLVGPILRSLNCVDYTWVNGNNSALIPFPRQAIPVAQASSAMTGLATREPLPISHMSTRDVLQVLLQARPAFNKTKDFP